MTVRELGQRMYSDEFTEWKAAWELEPFGDEWRRSTRIEAAVMNSFKGEDVDPVDAEALLPHFKRPKTEQTTSDHRGAMEILVGAWTA